MWLLDTTLLTLNAFFDDDIPHYAILSHTWGSGEMSFQDIRGPHEMISDRAGFKKIKNCCNKALEAGFQYVWIDTCCIDKTNNTELSEAINSMYQWYSNAVTCYAYLQDVFSHGKGFATSRWFTRGWTLQELIAPPDLLFLDHDWNDIGSRASLALDLEKVTSVPVQMLMDNDSLRDYCVAQIMSWAAGRKTTRIEDRAYSLLGLFGVSMPLIYGEGDNAFFRLQLEILKTTTDHSLFAWVPDNMGSFPGRREDSSMDVGPLARSVDDFRRAGNIRRISAGNDSSFEMTNLGLRITLPCVRYVKANHRQRLFARLNCKLDNGNEPVGILLREEIERKGTGPGTFYRVIERPESFTMTLSREMAELFTKDVESTPLYLIQHELRSAPRTMIQKSHICRLDVADLLEAGYLLYANTKDQMKPYHISRTHIIFSLPELSWHRPKAPKIIFFKHSVTAARLQLALSTLKGRIWCSIDSSIDETETPEYISKLGQVDIRDDKWERGQFVDHSIISITNDGERVQLTTRRGVISTPNRDETEAGFLIKFTLLGRSLFPTLQSEKDYVPLRTLYPSGYLPPDSTFGTLTEIL